MSKLRHTRRRPHPEPCTPDGAGTRARRAGRGRGRARPGKGSGNAPRLQRAGLGWELPGASAVGAGGRGALEGIVEPKARLAWVVAVWCVPGQGCVWFSGEGLAGARVAWAGVHRVGAGTACSFSWVC